VGCVHISCPHSQPVSMKNVPTKKRLYWILEFETMVLTLAPPLWHLSQYWQDSLVMQKKMITDIV
jgi:hypothetical protein